MDGYYGTQLSGDDMQRMVIQQQQLQHQQRQQRQQQQQQQQNQLQHHQQQQQQRLRQQQQRQMQQLQQQHQMEQTAQREHQKQQEFELSQLPISHSHQPTMSPMSADVSMIGGDSLDDIIRDNHHEMHRRRNSVPRNAHNPFVSDARRPTTPERRLSMMEFGSTPSKYNGYEFSGDNMPSNFQNLSNNMALTAHMDGGGGGDDGNNDFLSAQMMNNQIQAQRGDMSAGQMMDFANSNMMSLSDNKAYQTSLSPEMLSSMMPTNFANMRMSPIGELHDHNNNGGALFARPPQPMQKHQFNTAARLEDVTTDVGLDGSDSVMDMNMDTSGGHMADSIMTPADPPSDIANMVLSVPPQNIQKQQTKQNRNLAESPASSTSSPMRRPISSLSQDVAQDGPPRTVSSSDGGKNNGTLQTPDATASAQNSMDGTESSKPRPFGPEANSSQQIKKSTSRYSKSGFDMLKALWLVATRKNPEIDLGAVDMSCAFVVCDVTMNDCPIVYVSDNFQNLTGYSRHDTVGRNCRFLQAPDGKVESGDKRDYVDNSAVYNIKKKVHELKEIQQSLINYRKGGKPFLNLLTMIPIPWDTDEIRYFVGFQIDLVECPEALGSGQDVGGVRINYKHSDIGQYIWTPPASRQWDSENGQSLGVDDVSTLLQQHHPKDALSDWHKQSWDKMLLENTDDVVHVLSLKGLFLYLSPACKRVLEYDPYELVGSSLSSICHPSDIVPVTRELKDATAGNSVNIVFRIRCKTGGYTWFESHGSLFVEHGKGRKCIILIGRKRPVFALSRGDLDLNGGVGDSDLWSKMSTSGMFLFVSSNAKSLLDLQPDSLVGTSIQNLMRKESRPEFGRAIEKARRGKTVTCKHEVQNNRGQVLQAQTSLYPGDAVEGQKPTFLLAQTRLIKTSSRTIAPATASQASGGNQSAQNSGTGTNSSHHHHHHKLTASGGSGNGSNNGSGSGQLTMTSGGGATMVTPAMGSNLSVLPQDREDNVFEELRSTKCSSWQFELRQMEKINRVLAEELGGLLSNKKKRKRRKGVGNIVRDCANCHTRNTPEWRRGPSGHRDLCNSCGLRWAKQIGRVSPRNSSRGGGTGDSQSKLSNSPVHSSPLQRETSGDHINYSGTINIDGNSRNHHHPRGCSLDGNSGGDKNLNASDNRDGDSTGVDGLGNRDGINSTINNNNDINNNNNSNNGTSLHNNVSANNLNKPANSLMPPPSQPLLEGGSGFDQMTSIREERETSAPSG